MMRLNVEPGDVGFARGNGWLQKAIRYVEKDPHERQPAWANHSLLFTRAGIVGPVAVERQAWAVEALWHVEHNPWWDRHKAESGYRVQVFRPLFLRRDLADGWTYTDAGRVVDTALYHVGQRYGWWKLATHLVDRVFFRGVETTSRLMFLDNRPICSYLVAQAFEAVGYPTAFGRYIPARAQDPDDQHDHVTSAEAVSRWAYLGEVRIP